MYVYVYCIETDILADGQTAHRAYVFFTVYVAS